MPNAENMPSAVLSDVAKRLEDDGYSIRRAPYFHRDGIVAFVSSEPVPHRAGQPYGIEHVQVLGRSVFLHPVLQGWEARITWHGGRNWTMAAQTADDLYTAALDALKAESCAPAGWVET